MNAGKSATTAATAPIACVRHVSCRVCFTGFCVSHCRWLVAAAHAPARLRTSQVSRLRFPRSTSSLAVAAVSARAAVIAARLFVAPGLACALVAHYQ